MSPEHESCSACNSRLRDQWHDVVQERALAFDDAAHLSQVLVVDARDHHGVHLDQHPFVDGHLEPPLLLIDQDARGFFASDPTMVPKDPGIDLGPNLGIHAVDRDGQVIDVVLGELLDVIG